jgi:hypothetical protein
MSNLITHFANLCKVNDVPVNFISVDTFVSDLINNKSSVARDDVHEFLFQKGMDANIYEFEQTNLYQDFISDITSELEDLYI